MLMKETGCNILVGQNGRILVRCPNKELEEIVILSIKKIEAEAHTTGLTERVRAFIRGERSKRGV
jgi:exosome complex component RRP4